VFDEEIKLLEPDMGESNSSGLKLLIIVNKNGKIEV
jgi:hypothetical protein